MYARSAIYVDSVLQARSELATLKHPILGQVGELILGQLPLPDAEACTVFQSMGKCYFILLKLIIYKYIYIYISKFAIQGMAVEDAAVAQAVYDLYIEEQIANLGI